MWLATQINCQRSTVRLFYSDGHALQRSSKQCIAMYIHFAIVCTARMFRLYIDSVCLYKATETPADQEPPLPRLKTFKEVITALEDVAHYLEYKGLGDVALSVASNVDKLQMYSTTDNNA